MQRDKIIAVATIIVALVLIIVSGDLFWLIPICLAAIVFFLNK